MQTSMRVTIERSKKKKKPKTCKQYKKIHKNARTKQAKYHQNMNLKKEKKNVFIKILIENKMN